MGSAQRRFKNAVLQHGSILLGPEHLGILAYVKPDNLTGFVESNQMLAEKTDCLDAILNRRVQAVEVESCIKTGFEEYFRIRLETARLDATELQSINSLESTYHLSAKGLLCEEHYA